DGADRAGDGLGPRSRLHAPHCRGSGRHCTGSLQQQQMYPELSPVVRVYAPLGPDLIDYLSRIARYNRRPQAATDWRLDVHAGPDFLNRIRDEPPGGVAIFSCRNRGTIDWIIAAPAARLPVLAD